MMSTLFINRPIDTLNITTTNNIPTMTNLNNKRKNYPHYLVIGRMLFVYEVQHV